MRSLRKMDGKKRHDHYVRPLGAVLLNSLAFSIAATPVRDQYTNDMPSTKAHTLLDEVALVVDDADIALREILDRLIRHLPELLCDL